MTDHYRPLVHASGALLPPESPSAATAATAGAPGPADGLHDSSKGPEIGYIYYFSTTTKIKSKALKVKGKILKLFKTSSSTRDNVHLSNANANAISTARTTHAHTIMTNPTAAAIPELEPVSALAPAYSCRDDSHISNSNSNSLPQSSTAPPTAPVLSPSAAPSDPSTTDPLQSAVAPSDPSATIQLSATVSSPHVFRLINRDGLPSELPLDVKFQIPRGVEEDFENAKSPADKFRALKKGKVVIQKLLILTGFTSRVAETLMILASRSMVGTGTWMVAFGRYDQPDSQSVLPNIIVVSAEEDDWIELANDIIEVLPKAEIAYLPLLGGAGAEFYRVFIREYQFRMKLSKTIDQMVYVVSKRSAIRQVAGTCVNDTSTSMEDRIKELREAVRDKRIRKLLILEVGVVVGIKRSSDSFIRLTTDSFVTRAESMIDISSNAVTSSEVARAFLVPYHFRDDILVMGAKEVRKSKRRYFELHPNSQKVYLAGLDSRFQLVKYVLSPLQRFVPNTNLDGITYPLLEQSEDKVVDAAASSVNH